MATYTQLIYHIVFSTKYREKVLVKAQRPELFRYIWGIIKNRKGHLYRINGVEDHIHILTSLPTTENIADFVKTIKTSSNIWIKDNEIFPQFKNWQNGYGAFTVSAYEKNGLIEYIKNQEIHHQKQTFEYEYRQLLKQHDIEFREEYLF